MFLDAHGARPGTGCHFWVVGPHPVQEPRSHEQTLVLLGLSRRQPENAMASVPAAMMIVIVLLSVVFMVYLRLFSRKEPFFPMPQMIGNFSMKVCCMSNAPEFLPSLGFARTVKIA